LTVQQYSNMSTDELIDYTYYSEGIGKSYRVKLPYVKNEFWVKFRYVFTENVTAQVVFAVITESGAEYYLDLNSAVRQNQFITLPWQIPALKYKNCSFALDFYFEGAIKNNNAIRVKLMGQYKTFNVKTHYLLKSVTDAYEFVIYNNPGQGAIIHNVENLQYIEDIIDTATIIHRVQE
jgi:hypothetical protein